MCDVAEPFLFFVVKHTRGKDQDKSDASDHRASYDTCVIVCEMTKMSDEIRLKRTFPRGLSYVFPALLPDQDDLWFTCMREHYIQSIS